MTTLGHPSNTAVMLMKKAPAADARRPISVTPPEVPGGTTFIERMLRGIARESAPISVAHVSAVDAANAPAAAA
jgi:hypothetical protein